MPLKYKEISLVICYKHEVISFAKNIHCLYTKNKVLFIMFLMAESKILPVLIDCDPGADDVFGLLWLLINHQFAHLPMKVVGITTVGGNVAADPLCGFSPTWPVAP